jgi:hypothetical protein
MSYADVVGVDDQELRVARESQFFGERILDALRGRVVNCDGKQEQRQKCASFLFHGVTKSILIRMSDA